MKLRSALTYLVSIDIAAIAVSAVASGLAAARETVPGNTGEPGTLLVLGLALLTAGFLARARESS